jgi:pimeloyl-ACP methyl ester carboxylesterase
MRANDFDALRAFFMSPNVAPDPLDDVPPTVMAPCLLIVGEDDFAYAGMRKVAEQIPNATLVVVGGVGHTYGFTRSDLVLPHITAFLNKVDGTTG